jgi:prohibitin 2
MGLPLGLKIILAGIGIGIIIWLVLASVRTIDPGQKGVMVTWGAVDMSQVFGEGIHFVNPLGGQNLVPINVQTQLASEQASAASKDLQDVTTKVGIQYRLDGNQVNKLYRDIGLGYVAKLIQPITQEAIKQVTAQYNAGQLITQRETIKQKIQDVLTVKLATQGINVEQLSITDFNFSPEFNKAVELTATAQQKSLQAINDLKRIQIEAQQKVAVAFGQKNSTIAIAEGTGQAKVLEAAGQAKAIKLVNDALMQSPLYLQYQKIQTWNGVLPKVTGSGSGQIIALPSDILADDNVQTNTTFLNH